MSKLSLLLAIAFILPQSAFADSNATKVVVCSSTKVNLNNLPNANENGATFMLPLNEHEGTGKVQKITSINGVTVGATVYLADKPTQDYRLQLVELSAEGSLITSGKGNGTVVSYRTMGSANEIIVTCSQPMTKDKANSILSQSCAPGQQLTEYGCMQDSNGQSGYDQTYSPSRNSESQRVITVK